jgi:large subunit ribosomal protein L22
MVTRALEKYLKISPKKLAIVARLVSRKNVNEALFILMNVNKKGAGILTRVIESALNNAKRIPGKSFSGENLIISKINVNGGPTLKRFRAMTMGRAGTIRKRTSHVLVELDSTGESKIKESRIRKVKRIVKAGKK